MEEFNFTYFLLSNLILGKNDNFAKFIILILLQYCSKSKTGEAPLHLAAQNGHVKVVSVLVEDHGALLEAITLDNQTALHFSARYGQLAVAQTLLTLGANPNARDDKGQTPLHLAAEVRQSYINFIYQRRNKKKT